MRPRIEHGTSVDGDRASQVALLHVDAGLRAAVPAEELAVAERVVLAPCRTLDPGTWTPAELEVEAGAFAALLVEGLVTRETTIAGRRTADLLGPGDVFHPWRALDAPLPSTSRWASESPTLLAVLDERFMAAARRWPQL